MSDLSRVRFTWSDDPAQVEPYVVCNDCAAKLCSIEEGDTLSAIVSVAEEHRCDHG